MAELSEEDEQTLAHFNANVNLTPAQLREWLDTDASQNRGHDPLA